jgi:predicted lipoprotein
LKVRRQTISRRVKLALLCVPLLVTTGCKVVSIEADREARARHATNFDARSYIAPLWASRIIPALETWATDAPALLALPDQSGLDRYGKAHGRKSGEGSPWTFVIKGEGIVRAVDRQSRQGTIGLSIPMAGTAREMTLSIGPVIPEATIRDALPMFDFNDFADQMAYAAVSRALTERALATVRPIADHLSPGQRVRFLGVAHVESAADTVRVVPVRMEVVN